MLGLYLYDIQCNGRVRHKKGLIIATDIFSASFSISNQRSTSRLLNRYGRYHCKLRQLAYV